MVTERTARSSSSRRAPLTLSQSPTPINAAQLETPAFKPTVTSRSGGAMADNAHSLADRLAANDSAHDQHGDDVAHGFSRHARQHDNAYHKTNHAPIVADDAPDQYFGHDSEQDYVNDFRATQDEPHRPLPAAHPQSVVARADQHARSNRETGGAPYKRR
jgi:hypothetical protein